MNKKTNKPFVINYMMSLKKKDVSSFSNFSKSISSNTGNAYITHSLMKELYNWDCDFRGIPNIWEYDFSKQDIDLDYINNEATEVFLMLQDHIRPKDIAWNLPYEQLNQFLKKIKKQVHVIGIGSNFFGEYNSKIYKKIPQSLKTLLKTISSKTNVIGVRGEYTQDILNNIGVKNVEVIGCPTFYERGSNNIITVQPNIKMEDVVFTEPYKLDVFGNQPIILQGELEMMEGIIENPREIFRNGSYESLVKAYENRQYKIFSSIKEWKEFVSGYKFAIGSRVHGAILSVNTGVPAVVLNNDLRSREMCAVLKIPHLPELRTKTPLEIYDSVDYTEYNKNYPELYKKYVTFLEKNNLKIQDSLKPEAYIEQPSIQLYNNVEKYTEFADKFKNIDDKLEIILVTYNRKQYLKNTLDMLFADVSPIRDNVDITILDNASTDGTSELIQDYCKEHKRLKHIRHGKNIGGNANIIEAMKLAQKEYVWFLCDDDNYNWNHWYKVVQAMHDGYDAIIVERNWKTPDIPREIIPNELGFVPAAIYRSELITSEVIQNAYINIYNSFPHLALVCDLFNKNKKIKVIETPICIQGWALKTDKEYTRGFEDTIHPKQNHVNLFLGYVNSFQMLNDKNFRRKCCSNLWLGKSFAFSTYQFLKQNHDYLPNLTEYFLSISGRQKLIYIFVYLYYRLTLNGKFSPVNFARSIFSLKNENNHKVLRLLGFRIKIRRKTSGGVK